jgi:hypothetical protein
MPGTSTYIQVAEYALLEYTYSSETISTTQAKALRLYNNYTREYQFLNNAQATALTGNVLDYSAVMVSKESNKWGYLDVDSVSPIISIDPNITVSDISASLSPNLKYDKVKLHLLSGYDFQGIDGLILALKWNQWTATGTGGTPFTAGAQVYLKGDPQVKFSLVPFFLGDRLYDRYIEFKIPSLAEVNFDFWNSPIAPNTFGFQYTFNNTGFLQEGQINVSLYEITTTQIENGNRYFITGNYYETSFNQADLYSYISAVVRENPEFDYIEYFPTWNGEFMEDYINLLNEAGGDWAVVNQIEVYEQLGPAFLNTFSMTSLQTTALNAPVAFRPIIRNASLAITFTIEYTMRLLNKANGQEIVRKATFTSNEPKKYGAQIQKINVLEGYRPVKVYNKIVKVSEADVETSVQYVGTPTVMTQNVYVNSYYDVNYISVDSTTDIGSIPGGVGQTVFPQGMNTIFINKFDNYVKFKIFTKSADKKQNVSLNLSSNGMNIKLAFILDDESKIYIDPTQDQAAADPGAGEVLFRIDDSISTKLLGGKQREYYIVNKNDKGDEVLIYSGKFANQSERSKITRNQTSSMLSSLQQQVQSLSNTSNTLVSTVSTAAAATTQGTTSNETLAASQASQISQAQQSLSYVASTSSGLTNALNQAANNDKGGKALNLVDVPGITQNLSSNINNAITPNVVKPSEPSTEVTPQSVSSSAIKKKKPKL